MPDSVSGFTPSGGVSGTAASFGGARSRRRGRSGKQTSWMATVMMVKRKNPKMSLGEAMKAAKKLYKKTRRGGGGGGGVAGGLSPALYGGRYRGKTRRGRRGGTTEGADETGM